MALRNGWHGAVEGSGELFVLERMQACGPPEDSVEATMRREMKNCDAKSANAEIGAPGKCFKLDEGLNDLFAPLFEALFYFVHELVGCGTIHHTVIVGKSEIDHRANRDCVVNYHGAFLNCADA